MTTVLKKPRRRTSRYAIRAREKALECLALRKLGMNYRDIAEKVGYASAGAAQYAVRQVLDEQLEMSSEEIEAVRKIELERLDDIYFVLYEAVRKGDRASPRAAEVAVKVMERRSKLLGLDAADRTEVQLTVPKVVEFFRDPAQDAHQERLQRLLGDGSEADPSVRPPDSGTGGES